jgi:hypothetical protein
MCMRSLPPLFGQQTTTSAEVGEALRSPLLPRSVTLSPAQRAPLGARLRDTLQRVSSRGARGIAGDDAELSAHGGQGTAGAPQTHVLHASAHCWLVDCGFTRWCERAANDVST